MFFQLHPQEARGFKVRIIFFFNKYNKNTFKNILKLEKSVKSINIKIFLKTLKNKNAKSRYVKVKREKNIIYQNLQALFIERKVILVCNH